MAKILPERVKARLDALGINAFEAARRGNLGRNFVQQLTKGPPRSVHSDNLEKLQIGLAANEEYLTGATDVPGQVRIPVSFESAGDHLELGRELVRADAPYPNAIPEAASALGAGAIAMRNPDYGEVQGQIIEADVRDWWVLPTSLVSTEMRSRPDALVIFRVMSDSMEPEIWRTDHVVIDRSKTKIEPTGIWAIDEGFGLVLKRLIPRKKKTGATLVLRSANKAYPDEERSVDEVTIIGKYVGRFTLF